MNSKTGVNSISKCIILIYTCLDDSRDLGSEGGSMIVTSPTSFFGFDLVSRKAHYCSSLDACCPIYWIGIYMTRVLCSAK